MTVPEFVTWMNGLLAKLPKGVREKLVIFLKVLVEHLVKQHGRELATGFRSYAGAAQLLMWLGSAARCAVNVVVIQPFLTKQPPKPDCPHAVDPQHGLPLDL